MLHKYYYICFPTFLHYVIWFWFCMPRKRNSSCYKTMFNDHFFHCFVKDLVVYKDILILHAIYVYIWYVFKQAIFVLNKYFVLLLLLIIIIILIIIIMIMIIIIIIIIIIMVMFNSCGQPGHQEKNCPDKRGNNLRQYFYIWSNFSWRLDANILVHLFVPIHLSTFISVHLF